MYIKILKHNQEGIQNYQIVTAGLRRTRSNSGLYNELCEVRDLFIHLFNRRYNSNSKKLTIPVSKDIDGDLMI